MDKVGKSRGTSKTQTGKPLGIKHGCHRDISDEFVYIRNCEDRNDTEATIYELCICYCLLLYYLLLHCICNFFFFN